MAAAGFLSSYLSGSLPYVRCHITVRIKCFVCVVKSNISFLPTFVDRNERIYRKESRTSTLSLTDWETLHHSFVIKIFCVNQETRYYLQYFHVADEDDDDILLVSKYHPSCLAVSLLKQRPLM